MKRRLGTLIRDLVGYVAIALLVIGIVIALAARSANRGQPSNPLALNWLALSGVIAIVYATATYQHRQFWKNKRFWLGMMIALLLEIGVGIVVLRTAPLIKAWLWGLVIYPVNTIAMSEFLSRWLAGARPGQAA